MNVLLLYLQLQTLLLVNDCIYKSACFKTFPSHKVFLIALFCKWLSSSIFHPLRCSVATCVLLLFIGDGAIALLPREIHATEPTKVKLLEDEMFQPAGFLPWILRLFITCPLDSLKKYVPALQAGPLVGYLSGRTLYLYILQMKTI